MNKDIMTLENKNCVLTADDSGRIISVKNLLSGETCAVTDRGMSAVFSWFQMSGSAIRRTLSEWRIS